MKFLFTNGDAEIEKEKEGERESREQMYKSYVHVRAGTISRLENHTSLVLLNKSGAIFNKCKHFQN